MSTSKTKRFDNQKALSLLDGVYEIVELWKAESPSQKKWKSDWLRDVRMLGGGPEQTILLD